MIGSAAAGGWTQRRARRRRSAPLTANTGRGRRSRERAIHRWRPRSRLEWERHLPWSYLAPCPVGVVRFKKTGPGKLVCLKPRYRQHGPGLLPFCDVFQNGEASQHLDFSPMSRGPGVWQRRILDRVAAGTPFYLTELLPSGIAPSDAKYASIYQALWRAYRTLLEQGRLRAVMFDNGTPSWIVVLPHRRYRFAQRPPDPRSEFMRTAERPQIYGAPSIAPGSRLRLKVEERALVDATYTISPAELGSEQPALKCRWCRRAISLVSELNSSRQIARYLVAHARGCVKHNAGLR